MVYGNDFPQPLRDSRGWPVDPLASPLRLHHVWPALQLLLHVVGAQDLPHHAVHVQAAGVVAGVGLVCLGARLALHVELVVVQAARVGADAGTSMRR